MLNVYLLALVALAADVKHFERVVLDEEGGLHDAGGAHTGAQHILLGGYIARLDHIVDAAEEVGRGVVELDLGAAAVDGLHGIVSPQRQHGLALVGGDARQVGLHLVDACLVGGIGRRHRVAELVDVATQRLDVLHDIIVDDGRVLLQLLARQRLA